MHEPPISVYVPAGPGDPRDDPPAPPGVVVRRGPALHPDDLCVVRGLPCTSVARTLIDCAEELPEHELRACFVRAVAMGIFDPAAFRASRGRVEWRASLGMLDRVAAEFV